MEHELWILSAAVVLAWGCDSKPGGTDDTDTGTGPLGPGCTVEEMDIGLDVGLDAIWGFSAEDVWLIGDDGAIVQYDGSSWDKTHELDGRLEDIWGSSADDIWIVGSDLELEESRIWNYDGAQWTAVEHPRSQRIVTIWGSSETDIWAGGLDGENPGILHYDGSQWEVAEPEMWALRIRGGTSDDVWGLEGSVTDRILHYDGAQWQVFEKGPEIDALDTIRDVWGTSLAATYFVGEEEHEGNEAPMIVRYSEGSWSTVIDGSDLLVDEDPNVSGGLYSIWGDDSGRALALGLSNSYSYYFDGARWWNIGRGRGVDTWGTSTENAYSVTGQPGTVWHFSCP